MKAYLVGGAVRDELLGREVSDLDYVVVGSTIKQMLAYGFTQVGADFPVFLHPISKDEYALARTERKSGVGYKGFKVEFEPTVSLEQDLLRRDLTINAIAKASDGQLIDPYGGLEDIDNRVLRHVSLAFVEDPLRALRVARFAAQFKVLDFRVHAETMALISLLAQNGELSHLTPERVFKETEKALNCDNPEVFFEVLQDTGALEVLMPQINVFEPRAIARAKALSSLPQVCWAVFAYGCEGEVESLNQQLKVPTRYAVLANKVARFKAQLEQLFKLPAQSIVDLLNQLDCYRKPEQLAPFILACKALNDNDEYPQGEFLVDCYQQCSTIVVRPFVEQGFKGAEISKQVNMARSKAIASLIESIL